MKISPLLLVLFFISSLYAMEDADLGFGQEEGAHVEDAALQGIQRIEVERDCSICTDPFNDNVTIVKTACNHIFHQQCLLQWMGHNPVCPICRRPLREEELEIIPFDRLQHLGEDGNGYILEIPAADPHVVAHAPVHAVADVPYAVRVHEIRRNLLARTQRQLGYGIMAAAGGYLADHYLLRRLPCSVRNLIHQGAGAFVSYYLLHRLGLQRRLQRLPLWGRQLGRGILGVVGGWLVNRRHDLPYDVRHVGLSVLATGGLHQIFQSLADLDERRGIFGRQGGISLARIGASCFPIAAGLGLNGNSSLSPLVRQMSLIGGVGLGVADAMRLVPVPERRVLQSALAVGVGEALSRSDLPAPVRHISRFASGVGGAYLPNTAFGAAIQRYGYRDMWRPLHTFMFSTVLGRYHRESELSLLGYAYTFYRNGWNHLLAGMGGFALGRGARFFFYSGMQALTSLGESSFGYGQDSASGGSIARISRLVFVALMSVLQRES